MDLLIAQAAGEYVGVAVAGALVRAMAYTEALVFSIEPMQWVMIAAGVTLLSFLIGWRR